MLDLFALFVFQVCACCWYSSQINHVIVYIRCCVALRNLRYSYDAATELLVLGANDFRAKDEATLYDAHKCPDVAG